MKKKLNHKKEDVDRLLEKKKDEMEALKKIFEKLSNINKSKKQ